MGVKGLLCQASVILEVRQEPVGAYIGVKNYLVSCQIRKVTDHRNESPGTRPKMVRACRRSSALPWARQDQPGAYPVPHGVSLFIEYTHSNNSQFVHIWFVVITLVSHR